MRLRRDILMILLGSLLTMLLFYVIAWLMCAPGGPQLGGWFPATLMTIGAFFGGIAIVGVLIGAMVNKAATSPVAHGMLVGALQGMQRQIELRQEIEAMERPVQRRRKSYPKPKLVASRTLDMAA